MSTSRKVALALAVIAVVGALPLAALGRVAAAKTYSNATIEGLWTWSVDGSLGTRYRYAQIGTASFDGKGECVLTLIENSGLNAAYDHNSDACTYEVAKTGMGSMVFSLDGEAGAASIAVGKGEIRLSVPDAANVGVGVLKRYTALDVSELSGSWSFSYNGTIFSERIAGAGVTSFDGAGKCEQLMAYNYGTGVQNVTTESCVYEVSETGIGSATLTYDNGTGGDFFFIPRAGGKELVMLTKVEGEILLGEARRR